MKRPLTFATSESRRAAVPDHERDEAGLTTAEYAVGTLGAVTIAGVLLTLGASPWFFALLRTVLERVSDLVPSWPPGGIFPPPVF